MNAIDVTGLSHGFGGTRVLDDLDLRVAAGEHVTITGANGSGKTTLLRALCGLLRPAAGRVEVLGGSTDDPDVRRRMAVILHAPPLYTRLSATENIEIWSRLYDSDGAAGAELLAALGLDPSDRRPVSAYSQGMRQRVAVARALATAPEIVVADEPFAGLDDAGAAAVASLLATAPTLVVATHERHAPEDGRVLALRAGKLRSAPAGPVPTERSASSGEGVRGREHPPPIKRPGVRGREHPPPINSPKLRTLLRKDLLTELRSAERLATLLLFCLAVVVTLQFSLPPAAPARPLIAAGFIWATIVFAAMLELRRSFESERAAGTLDGLRAAPIDPVTLYAAKALSSAIVLALLACVLIPAASLGFGGRTSGLAPAIGVAVLGIAGLVAWGTLFAAVAGSSRSSEIVLPILLFPLVIPQTIACVRLLAFYVTGSQVGGTTTGFVLLAAFDLVAAGTSVLLFDYVLDE